jgi:hypothetical protein
LISTADYVAADYVAADYVAADYVAADYVALVIITTNNIFIIYPKPNE